MTGKIEETAQNVDRLRRTYEAFNRGDFDVAIEIARHDIEFIRTGGQAPVSGAEAFRAWMEPDAIEDSRLEPLEFRTNGNRVLVRQRNHGRGTASGIELEMEAWAVWTFDDDGLVTRVEGFAGHERTEAFSAAGLAG